MKSFGKNESSTLSYFYFKCTLCVLATDHSGSLQQLLYPFSKLTFKAILQIMKQYIRAIISSSVDDEG